ncbi:MAG: M67 family metallopeptidase [Methylococcaceae bacterium]|nr:M67 family metallopeptidase [Methylococcaceae bacterium]
MCQKELHISRKLTNQLLHLAQLSTDLEICGLLGGKNGLPTNCYPVQNIADQPGQRFLFDPGQQITAMKKMREANEELFAIYHSHPTAPAIPSSTDLELAAYPNAFYLIISLNTKGVLEMRAFKIRDKTATEIAILLHED